LLVYRGSLSYGFDIVALNAQRGRDHGLPSYNSYRQMCGLSKLTTFADVLTNGLAPQVATLLSQVYTSVDDIDLYIGGLTEIVASGGNLGPTFSCLIAENFAQLKKSDRFFYENSGQRHSFTSGKRLKMSSPINCELI
jgi:peroxidase